MPQTRFRAASHDGLLISLAPSNEWLACGRSLYVSAGRVAALAPPRRACVWMGLGSLHHVAIPRCVASRHGFLESCERRLGLGRQDRQTRVVFPKHRHLHVACWRRGRVPPSSRLGRLLVLLLVTTIQEYTHAALGYRRRQMPVVVFTQIIGQWYTQSCLRSWRLPCTHGPPG